MGCSPPTSPPRLRKRPPTELEKKVNQLQLKVDKLYNIIMYSPPTDLLPNGGPKYQEAKDDFTERQNEKPS